MKRAEEIFLSGITKHFGSVAALEGVDFTLRPGRVHALLGENGAGKSTLMGIAFGLIQPNHGTIRVAGAVRAFRSPRDAIRAGIGMVQQHFSLVPALSVAENVALGKRGIFHPATAEDLVRRTAVAAGLELDPRSHVRDLSVEGQQRLEIIRALAHGARTLILDEPTAVLAPEEAAMLLRWLRAFASEGGSVAIVTHKVNEALSAADDITVLRAGVCVAGGPASQFSAHSLARVMFPDTPVQDSMPLARVSTDAPILVTARHVRLARPDGGASIADASFIIRAGEIIGLVGVEGAGHASLLRALAGLAAPQAGALELPAAVSFIPADRHRDALVLDFPLFENVALRQAGRRRGLIPWAGVREQTRRVLDDFEIRVASERVPAHTLSGGNQQRFVLGRELDPHPMLIVAENPTRGLDLRAAGAIRRRLEAAADAGAAVVMYSSDIDEVLAVASRIFVVYQGSVREVHGNRDAVARAMVGGG